jgi:hypothetical protein
VSVSDPTDDVWAFWTHDLYPYVLGGKIDPALKFGDRPELVYVPSYQGWFTPLVVVKGTEGALFDQELRRLKYMPRRRGQENERFFLKLLEDAVLELTDPRALHDHVKKLITEK